jgi:hypothetical protein
MLPVGLLSFRLLLSLQWSKAVGMWAKATAVGNAARAAARCPWSQEVRRRRIDLAAALAAAEQCRHVFRADAADQAPRVMDNMAATASPTH